MKRLVVQNKMSLLLTILSLQLVWYNILSLQIYSIYYYTAEKLKNGQSYMA
jgi:hypothetical protein